MSAALDIGPADAAEFDTMVAWARAEGWDLGLGDGAVFRGFDPGGFLVGRLDGEPVACISVVRYGPAFGFLGFYICRPEFRGRGLGWATWQAGLARLGERTVGLDGVVAQQANYRKSGFVLAHNNASFAGRPTVEPPADPRIRTIGPDLLPAVIDYDRPFFAGPRESFLADWIGAAARSARALVEDGRVRGYAVMRRGAKSTRFGPLFADDEAVADALFRSLAAEAPEGPVSIDLPLTNPAAQRLAERYGLAPVFETARMYRGPAPDLPLPRIYGITSFELG